MNDDNFQSLRNLISLKRHEQPDDAYFDELLEEFHRRQQQDHLKPSLRREISERVSVWFASTSRWNYVMGAGAAYALVFFAVIFFWPKPDVTPILNTAPIQHQQQVEATEGLDEKALEANKGNEAMEGRGEQVVEPQAY
jgi:hypothetical protein